MTNLEEQIKEINPNLTQEEVAFMKKEIAKPNMKGKVENAIALQKEFEKPQKITDNYKNIIAASPQGILMETSGAKNDEGAELLRQFYLCAKEIGFGFNDLRKNCVFSCGIFPYLLLAKYREIINLQCSTDVQPNQINIVRGR